MVNSKVLIATLATIAKIYAYMMLEVIYNEEFAKLHILVMLTYKLYVHFPFQISSVKGYEQEATIAYASLLDIEGRTEEAIATLETISNMSSIWHLARVSLTI